MSVFHNNALIGAGGGTAAAAADANITKSLRFNSGDSAYLSRTPSSAGNRRTWTWAGWLKVTEFPSAQCVFFGAKGSSGNANVSLDFNTAALRIVFWNGSGTDAILTTTQVFRDPSAWYHVVYAVDTTQATSANRVKIYINGAQVTDFSTETYPSQNYETFVNNNTEHNVGRNVGNSSAFYRGYLADVYMVDGSQLEPTSFGAYDDNGVWQAAAYSGTYGTNGFHLLDFENESTIGHDSSGNNNDFTANNFTESVVVPNKGFDCVAYTGNYGTQSVTGLSFQPDFVWLKDLSTSNDHNLYDVVRGVNKKIVSNSTAAESTVTNVLNSFDASGFSIGDSGQINSNGNSYIAWCWKAGGAAVSNTDGTITSSVSANNTYGFSIIKHTGTNAAGTFGHGLNSAPKFMIFKNLEATDNWFVWHTSFGSATTGAVLNSTNDYFTNGTNELNSTVPTASVIHVGSNLATNGNNQEVITYAWSEVAGFSKFGSYTGNGSSSGPSVTGLGFKPRWILIKGDLDGEDWVIVDTVRSPTNPNKKLVAPNSSAQEFTHPGSAYDMDIDDDGFTVKNDNPRWNTNNKTYIYAAFGSGSGSPEDLDVLFDVPVNGTQTDSGAGGEVSGNHATLNPLNKHTSNNSFTNGNLHFTTSGSDGGLSESTIAVSSGKFYFEVVYSRSDQGQFAGIRKPGSRNYNDSYIYVGTGNKYTNGGSGASYGATLAHGDVIGTAFDADNGTLEFFKNGTSQGTAFTGISGAYSFFVGSFGGAPTGIVNFGQRPFTHAAPSGFKALNTANLPTATVPDGSDYFDTLLWTGDGASSTRTITGLSMENAPDWIWAKERNGGSSHALFDAVRGFGTNNVLKTNSTDAQGGSNGGYINSTSTSSLTWAQGTSTAEFYDANGKTYVAWCWDAGSSTVSNTDGSITASVRANQTAGFSIVKYTGQSGGGSWGHGLSAAPDFILFKRYTSAQNWFTFFREADGTYLEFEGINDPRAAFSSRNNVTATSTTITLPNQAEFTNDTSSSYIAYCVSNVDSYSQAGFYDGNGSTDGTFIHTNFAPAFVLIKATGASTYWNIKDNKRYGYNPVLPVLHPNRSDAEGATQAIDLLSNGFKIRSSDGGYNTSGGQYAYLAFASNPFQANGGLAR
jgi:hypothetical protein